VEFKHTQASTNDLKTQQVASIGRDGRGGGSHSCQSGCGQGQSTSNVHQRGLVPQAEIDTQTQIMLRAFSNDEYKRLTPAKRAKIWQLRYPWKTLGLDQPYVTAMHLLH
jgi:hypothetical protein